MATPTWSPDMSPLTDSDIPHTEHRLRSGRLGVIAIAFIVVNILVDVLYVLVNPRIRSI